MCRTYLGCLGTQIMHQMWLSTAGSKRYSCSISHKHKKEKTFGPNGLSRRDPAPGDPVFANSEEYEDEPYRLPEIDLGSASEEDLHDIKDFAATEKVTCSGVLHRLGISRKKIKCFLAKLGNKPRISTRWMAYAQIWPQCLLKCCYWMSTTLIKTKWKIQKHQRTLGRSKNQDCKRMVEGPFSTAWGMSDKEYRHFVCYARQFFLKDDKLYKRAENLMHRLFVEPQNHMYIMAATHDSLGHWGFFATKSLIEQRFWWPEYERDVNWYVKTCHICQKR